MSVYVDNFNKKYGRMIMCHMSADTVDELHAMVDRIGLPRKYYQDRHYDICLSNKNKALQFGAIEISVREMVKVRNSIL